MLYLVTAELENTPAMPTRDWLGLVLKGMEQVQELKNQGKVLFHGAHVGRQAGVLVLDAASNEELQSLLLGLPYWPFMEWRITPLVSTEVTIESLKQSLAHA